MHNWICINVNCSLTRVLINPLLHSVLLLVNPLAVALEIDLGGGCCLAIQIHWLVLDYVGLLWFHQKHRQRLWGVWRVGFWQLAETNKVILNCEERQWHRNRWKAVVRKRSREKIQKISEDSGTVYYNRSLCTGLSIHTAHSEIPIIWYFGMFTQVYFRRGEILGFLSGNETVPGFTESGPCLV